MTHLAAKTVGYWELLGGCVAAYGFYLSSHGRPVLGFDIIAIGLIIAGVAWSHRMHAVRLRRGRIEYGSLLRRRVVESRMVDSVVCHSVEGVVLRLKDGSTRRIPSLGNARTVAQAVEAWIKTEQAQPGATDNPDDAQR